MNIAELHPFLEQTYNYKMNFNLDWMKDVTMAKQGGFPSG